MGPKHFLNFEKISNQEFVSIIERGIELKNSNETEKTLKGKILGLVFEQPSYEKGTFCRNWRFRWLRRRVLGGLFRNNPEGIGGLAGSGAERRDAYFGTTLHHFRRILLELEVSLAWG